MHVDPGTMTLGETPRAKHSAHNLISVGWAGAEGALAAAGPHQVSGGGCSAQLALGCVSAEIGELERRKARAGGG